MPTYMIRLEQRPDFFLENSKNSRHIFIYIYKIIFFRGALVELTNSSKGLSLQQLP